MSDVLAQAIESKAERKARKEQRKAQKQAEKPSLTEVDSDEKDSQSSKRKRDDDGAEETTGDLNHTAADKNERKDKKDKKERKEKKSKRVQAAVIETDAQPTAVLVSETSVAMGEPSDLPESPMLDSTLSDQAQKALQYVHLHKQHQISDPTTEKIPGRGWKFNKARQNWCIRNYWNPAEVHEKYVELVLGYLQTTVGAARQNIIEQAKEYRDTPLPTIEVAEGTTTPVIAEAGVEATGAEVEEKVTEEPKVEAVETEEAAMDVTLVSERKRRAEMLLEKMSP